jgi:DNA-directed RNA polymerase
VAKLTFEALKEMFLGAKSIMEWLAECAKRIAQRGRPVTWITPMGLPVSQPYRRSRQFEVRVLLEGLLSGISRADGLLQVRTVTQKVTLVEPGQPLPVSVARQKSAFPPNFVHSLDSTHMMYTAVACHQVRLSCTSMAPPSSLCCYRLSTELALSLSICLSLKPRRKALHSRRFTTVSGHTPVL